MLGDDDETVSDEALEICADLSEELRDAVRRRELAQGFREQLAEARRLPADPRTRPHEPGGSTMMTDSTPIPGGDQLGRVAHETFVAAGGRAQGWDQLDPAQRAAWRAAAQTVADATISRTSNVASSIYC